MCNDTVLLADAHNAKYVTKIGFLSVLCINLQPQITFFHKNGRHQTQKRNYFRIMRTYRITGTPKRGVTTLSGMSVPSGGKLHTQLQASPTMPPTTRVSGMTMRWLAVCEIIFAIWGTARPINDIGPQKAVVMAEISPVATSMVLRMRFTLKPRLLA